MYVADWVAEVFRKQGIERIFLYPGGTVAPLINACLQAGIRMECFKSEQGAGYAALAYARITGKPQVMMVTSGPGVTNAVTPLADAYYDSTPLILVAGQIGTGDLMARKSVRQRGFQEVPTVELTQSISKKATCLVSLQEVFREVPEAFELAAKDRKGPVVLDFPMDMQRKELKAEELPSATDSSSPDTANPQEALNSQLMAEITSAAAQAKRPVLLLGQGALSARAYDQYFEIAKATDALVVTSLLGIGSYDTADPCCLGYVGHTGHLAANRAVYESDFLLVLGSRLDVRQTGTLVQKFVPNGSVVWVDTDPAELANPRVNAKWKIQSDVAKFCREFLRGYQGKTAEVEKAWQESMVLLKREQLEDPPQTDSKYLQPRPVLHQLGRLIDDEAVTVVTGVGCHQHWAARHMTYRPNLRQFLTSGGHGTMGYDLPAAIGAAMALPDRKVLCVVGDGSLLMNIQELASLQERNLNVKVLVMDNSRLGIVSQFQLITWGTDPTTGDFISPDFVAIANGFGVAADRVDTAGDLENKLRAFWDGPGPALLEVTIDPTADVVPMLLAGQHMGEMWMGRKS